MTSFFLNRQLPPNLEGSAEPCEAIGASLRRQVKIVFLRNRRINTVVSRETFLYFFIKKWPSREPLVRFTIFISLYFEWFGISRTFGKEEWE